MGPRWGTQRTLRPRRVDDPKLPSENKNNKQQNKKDNKENKNRGKKKKHTHTHKHTQKLGLLALAVGLKGPVGVHGLGRPALASAKAFVVWGSCCGACDTADDRNPE